MLFIYKFYSIYKTYIKQYNVDKLVCPSHIEKTLIIYPYKYSPNVVGSHDVF